VLFYDSRTEDQRKRDSRERPASNQDGLGTSKCTAAVNAGLEVPFILAHSFWIAVLRSSIKAPMAASVVFQEHMKRASSKPMKV